MLDDRIRLLLVENPPMISALVRLRPSDIDTDLDHHSPVGALADQELADPILDCVLRISRELDPLLVEFAQLPSAGDPIVVIHRFWLGKWVQALFAAG